jgi:hypothetical protein
MAFCWHCGASDHTDQEMLQCMMLLDIDAYLQLEELGLLDEETPKADADSDR